MAKLTEDVKLFIVQALACYDTPAQVSEAVKDEFGLVVPRQQCESYDPTKYVGRALSKKWRVVFDSARKNFKDGVAEVPIANRVFRLRALARMASKAEAQRNFALTSQMLEQAAKEVGDAYVNRPRGVQGEGQGEEPVAQKVERGVKDARRYDNG